MKYITNILAIIGLGLICAIPIYALSDSKVFVKNNSSRDYKYENYCDSIYLTNPDYFDVLIETDEFQSYVEEHGEWY